MSRAAPALHRVERGQQPLAFERLGQAALPGAGARADLGRIAGGEQDGDRTPSSPAASASAMPSPPAASRTSTTARSGACRRASASASSGAVGDAADAEAGVEQDLFHRERDQRLVLDDQDALAHSPSFGAPDRAPDAWRQRRAPPRCRAPSRGPPGRETHHPLEVARVQQATRRVVQLAGAASAALGRAAALPVPRQRGGQQAARATTNSRRRRCGAPAWTAPTTSGQLR